MILSHLHKLLRWLLCVVVLLIGWLLFPIIEKQPGATADEATVLRHSEAAVLRSAHLRRSLLERLGIFKLHNQNTRGRGIKVAVLDSGFRGYRSLLGKVLPQEIGTCSLRQDGNLEAPSSEHGILCAETIHTLAPGAELLLINWDLNDPQSFLNAVRTARKKGADIISCSIVMPSWSDGEGGGLVNETVAKIAGAGDQSGDMLFFASAGNMAQRHWRGIYQPDSADWHQWEKGYTANLITPWSTGQVGVEIYGAGLDDFLVEVRDAIDGEEVATVFRTSLGGSSNGVCLSACFRPKPGHRYLLRLRRRGRAAKTTRQRFHVTILGGYLRHCTAAGSIPCPADGPGVLAVGAVDESGQRCDYSSCGPNSTLPKPDFVAETPFPSRWRERPFTGTSAAAPQAAGVAALLWSQKRHWSAAQVRNALRRSAIDLGPPGHDTETGFGRIRLPLPR